MNGLIDPQDAGFAQAAGILGKLGGPSRMPIGIGSILGQAGAAAQQGRMQAQQHNDQSQMRQAQMEALKEQAEARQAAMQAQQEAAAAKGRFQSILGAKVKAGEQPDEISILGAGIESGAFGPKEITDFMSKVTEKQASREASLEKERMRLQDRAIAREEREASERRLIELRGEIAKDRDRLLQTMKPAAQEPLVPVQKDGQTIYAPRSQAVGEIVPPRNTGDKLTEAEAKGTLFFRQMRAAEEAAGATTFDTAKLKSQIDVRLANSDMTNWAASDNAQKYAQAAEQWAEAYLRLKTGAATTRDEIKRNARAYFPQPGDRAEVVKQKNDMRQKAIEDVSILAGRGVDKQPSDAAKPGGKPWERKY